MTEFVVFLQPDLVRRFSFLQLYQDGVVSAWSRDPEHAEKQLVEPYNVLVVDLVCQQEQGLELAKKIKARDRELKVILIEGDQPLPPDAPAHAVLPRDVDLETLVTTIRTVERSGTQSRP